MLQQLLDEYSNKINISKLSKKSKVSEQRINELIDNPNDMTLLEGCKLGIGFKKCGIYVDEYMLIDEERHEELHSEWFMRTIQHNETEDDAKYLELQRNVVPALEITRRRVNKGLSRRALAELTDVDVRSIEKYETGEKHIEVAAAKTVYALAKGLECRMEDLLRKEYL